MENNGAKRILGRQRYHHITIYYDKHLKGISDCKIKLYVNDIYSLRTYLHFVINFLLNLLLIFEIEQIKDFLSSMKFGNLQSHVYILLMEKGV